MCLSWNAKKQTQIRSWDHSHHTMETPPYSGRFQCMQIPLYSVSIRCRNNCRCLDAIFYGWTCFFYSDTVGYFIRLCLANPVHTRGISEPASVVWLYCTWWHKRITVFSICFLLFYGSVHLLELIDIVCCFSWTLNNLNFPETDAGIGYPIL